MAMLYRVWIVAIGLAMVIVLSHVWMQRAVVQRANAIATPATATTTSVLDTGLPPLPARPEDWAESRVDLNGNEIDVAVGDYRVDRRGEMYERHAPDTALLHLSAPKL